MLVGEVFGRRDRDFSGRGKFVIIKRGLAELVGHRGLSHLCLHLKKLMRKKWFFLFSSFEVKNFVRQIPNKICSKITFQIYESNIF